MSTPLKNAKGGRPRKDEDEKRSVRLNCYVTKSEAALIHRKTHHWHGTTSDFLRKLALNKEMAVSVRPEVVSKLRADIGRAMGNINQIAKKVNQGKVRAPEETELAEIYDFLADKLDALEEL